MNLGKHKQRDTLSQYQEKNTFLYSLVTFLKRTFYLVVLINQDRIKYTGAPIGLPFRIAVKKEICHVSKIMQKCSFGLLSF